MNRIKKTDQSYQQTTNWEELTFEKEFYSYNEKKCKNEKKKIQIKITSDQKIIYSQNGAILRVVECLNIIEQPEIFNNLDQIHNLSWQGQQDKNKKKDGKWIAFWNGVHLINVGGQKGQKYGLWKDLFPNYQSTAQIFEIGEYHNDFRIGRWNYISQDGKIGGGSYNKEGWKLGKWIELDEGFNDDKKVTYHGEYNINGMKVGRWDIMYCKYNEKEYKQIGGGSYDQEGNQKKIGKWVELDEEFCCDSEYVKQITYNGQYNMNGMKVGRWDIMYCRKWEMKYTYIGGGSYDLEGNQKKIGKWVELDEEFCCDSDFVKKIIYNGQYNMNGMKVGRWDTMYCENEEYQQSGGGSYDLEGNQQKIGKWVELDEEFNYWKQVTYIGEYNMNNMKVGRWDTMHCENEEYQQIGGGSYDQEGNQKKIGKWVELFEGFFCYAKVIYNGEYNMDGMKVGKWDIMYCKREEQEYKQIGGGSYDQEGNQKKIGKWIELNERFYYSSESHFNQIIYIGEYNNNGQKAGIWVEIDIYFNNKIGEKRYDD